MSYILDALKKSEQQRQRGAAPSLAAAPAIDTGPRRSAALRYGLAGAAVLLLVVGITIGTLRPWDTETPASQPVAAKSPAAAVPPPVQAPVAAATPAPASVEITIRTEPPAPGPVPPAPAVVPAATEAPKAPARAAVPPGQATVPRPPAAEESRPPAPAGEKPAGARPSDVAPERPVLPLAELPLPIQQELPRLSILYHIYSANPRDRLVGINDRALREGDAVEPGLVLEQITAEGMILNYKGYRFLRGPR